MLELIIKGVFISLLIALWLFMHKELNNMGECKRIPSPRKKIKTNNGKERKHTPH